MSMSDKLKKAAVMTAIGASFLAPEARAQSTSTEAKAPDRMEQSVKSDWTWGTDATSIRAKAAYESLPAEYKAFAGKSFMERLEMREEWEQKDFLKRDRKRSAILRRNPDATIKEFSPRSSIPDAKLADFPVAEGSFITKIELDKQDGKLSPLQAIIAEEVLTMGRPLASIDPNLPYAEQLKACGFDMMASVVSGTQFRSLSARDRSIFIAQDQNAGALNDRNEEARRDLRIRLYEEDAKAWNESHSWFSGLFSTETRLLTEKEMEGKFPREVINGKDVAVPQPNEQSYSIHDEVTRKVAAKIEHEEQMAAKRAKDAVLTQ